MHRGLLLLLLATTLAGCSEDSTPEPVATPEDDAVAGLELEATQDTGVIRGVVVDETITPLADATIRIDALDREARTNADGAFGFDGLDPGSYAVEARKLGFTSSQQVVAVEADIDRPPVVKFLLQRDINATPYFSAFQWTGFMECSTSALQVCGAPNTAIQTFCEGGVPPFCDLPQEVTNDDFLERFDVDKPPTWVQAELVWESTQVLGDRLNLIVEAYKIDGLAFQGLGSNTGPSPVLVAADQERVNGTDLGKPGGSNEGLTQLQLRVFAGGSDAANDAVGAVAQQKFEAFVHVFYGYEPTEGWRFTQDTDVPRP